MIAQAQVETTKSSRYLQTLCGHFSRKTKADYDAQRGRVNFGYGYCEMRAEPGTLVLQTEADHAEDLVRIKRVVGSHLERFAFKDGLKVQWNIMTPTRSVTDVEEPVS